MNLIRSHHDAESVTALKLTMISKKLIAYFSQL